MGYKKVEKTISFAEVSLLSSIENNRTLKMMEQISEAANWENREGLFEEYYSGQRHVGADAYSLLRFQKCMLPHQCFHITSEPIFNRGIH